MKRWLLEEDLDTPEADMLLADIAAIHGGDPREYALDNLRRLRETCHAQGLPFLGLLNPKYMRPGPQPFNFNLAPNAEAAIQAAIGHIPRANNPPPKRVRDGAPSPGPVRPVQPQVGVSGPARERTAADRGSGADASKPHARRMERNDAEVGPLPDVHEGDIPTGNF